MADWDLDCVTIWIHVAITIHIIITYFRTFAQLECLNEVEWETLYESLLDLFP